MDEYRNNLYRRIVAADPSKAVGAVQNGDIEETYYAMLNSGQISNFPNLGPTTFPKNPVITPISIFQAGHGWSSAGTGATPFAADTTDFVVGTQSLKGSTSGSGGGVELKAPTLTAMDLRGKGLAFQIKVDNPDRLNYATLYWGNGNYANFRTAGHLMYEGTGASSRLLPNDWTWVYVPVSDSDTLTGALDNSSITDMKMLFVDMNTGPLTVWVQQIGTFTPQTAYPNGVLTVTCDDSLLSQYTYLPRILGKYNAPATLLMIKDQMPGVQGFSVDQAHWMQDTLGYELGGHAFTKANHDRGLATLSSQELADELGALKSWLVSEGFNGKDLLAWPVGSNSVPSTKIARKYFSWARHTGGKYGQPVTPTQPMRHQAVTITSDTPVNTFKGYIDYAKAHARQLTLMVHQIVSSGASGQTNVNVADLQAIIDYAVSVGMPIRTVGQVMRGE